MEKGKGEALCQKKKKKLILPSIINNQPGLLTDEMWTK